MAKLGFKEVLKNWLQEDGCNVTFQTVTGSNTPSLIYVQKGEKKSWVKWDSILEAWQNGLSVQAIAKRIVSCGPGSHEVA